MISVAVDGIVLDIEGTVSSIDFVYHTMFPYVRRELDDFLSEHFDEPDVQAACRQISADGNLSQFDFLSGHPAARADAVAIIRGEVLRLMDGDAKVKGLKQLQGLIWRKGFESRELVAQIYPDVPPRLKEWSASGIKLYVYSSGSVEAQKLFFGHTHQGDLRGYLSGYFDTSTGPKRESTSYSKIAAVCRLRADRLIFLSDVSAELAAASAAGFQVGLCLRPGNAPQPDADRWPQITSFGQLDLRR